MVVAMGSSRVSAPVNLGTRSSVPYPSHKRTCTTYRVSTCTPPTDRLFEGAPGPFTGVPMFPESDGSPDEGASCSGALALPLSCTGVLGLGTRPGCVNPGMASSSRSSSS